ncbi:MAG: hypothetical protein AAFR95_13930 [Bacteroidota bacterium]
MNPTDLNGTHPDHAWMYDKDRSDGRGPSARLVAHTPVCRKLIAAFWTDPAKDDPAAPAYGFLEFQLASLYDDYTRGTYDRAFALQLMARVLDRDPDKLLGSDAVPF